MPSQKLMGKLQQVTKTKLPATSPHATDIHISFKKMKKLNETLYNENSRPNEKLSYTLEYVANTNINCTMYYIHMSKKCNGFIPSILQQTGNKQDYVAFAKSKYFHFNTGILNFFVPTSKSHIPCFNLVPIFLKLVLLRCGFAICKLFESSLNVLLHSSISLKYIPIKNRESQQKRIWIDALSFLRWRTPQKLKGNINAYA